MSARVAHAHARTPQATQAREPLDYTVDAGDPHTFITSVLSSAHMYCKPIRTVRTWSGFLKGFPHFPHNETTMARLHLKYSNLRGEHTVVCKNPLGAWILTQVLSLFHYGEVAKEATLKRVLTILAGVVGDGRVSLSEA